MSESHHEIAKGSHPHIESRHDGSEAVFCLVSGGECGVVFEIHANAEEQKKLEAALLTSVEYLDRFFDGKFAGLFKGLEVEIGDNLTEGGGEALSAENKIVLDRQKMLMTVRESDALLAELGMAHEGDRLRAVPEELHDMSVAVYEFVHEVGHIVHDRSEGERPTPSDLAAKSPTHLYLQDPTRANEAVAEGFAYMVFGQEIDSDLGGVVRQSVDKFKESVGSSRF